MKASPCAHFVNDLWRLDINVLHDDYTLGQMKDSISAALLQSSDASWDRLKCVFADVCIQAGRQRRVRFSNELNDVLHRIRVVSGSPCLSFAMREYLEVLRSRYDLVLRRYSRAASLAAQHGRTVNDPAVLRHVRAASHFGAAPLLVPHVALSNGTVSSRHRDIEKVFVGYFRNIFSSEVDATVEGHLARVQKLCDTLPKVSPAFHEMLCAPATCEELRAAVHALNPKSTPGPDGIPNLFYQKFFPAIHAPLLKMVNSFLCDGSKPFSFREGRITLLPKPGGCPSEPQSWRPITLLNSDYKIVASLMGRRLRCVLPEIVSRAQTCSVQGRTIFSSLALTRDLFAYMSRCGLPGAFVSLDQAKAFDRVEHSYLFAVLSCFGFPASFVNNIALLYEGASCALLLNGQLTDSFYVTRGVRQGCPLSPMLFILALEPLLRKVLESPRIRGFPLPGQSSVKVSAYADDVSLFLRDGDSYLSFLRIFEEYGALSGGRLNHEKTKALAFGSFSSTLQGQVEWVTAVKVLGITFLSTGNAATSTWRELLKKARCRLVAASAFDLPLAERAFLIKTLVLPVLTYVGKVSVPPKRYLRQFASAVGEYLWSDKTQLVSRHLLRLPSRLGGFSLPCLQTLCSVLSLRTIFDLLSDEEYPGRRLLLYWLGTARRLFPDLPTGGPSAERPFRYYARALKQRKITLSVLPDIEVGGVPTARVCEELAVNQLTEEELERCNSVRWKYLVPRGITGDVRNFAWLRGWDVLPTRERLARWGVSPTDRCPQCGQVETLDHALFSCVVARTFWLHVHQMFGIRENRRRQKNTFAALVVVLGAFLIWRRRCCAAMRRRPQRAMFPLLRQLRVRIRAHLEQEFAISGEDDFLRRWSTRFISIQAGRVVLHPHVPY